MDLLSLRTMKVKSEEWNATTRTPPAPHPHPNPTPPPPQPQPPPHPTPTPPPPQPQPPPYPIIPIPAAKKVEMTYENHRSIEVETMRKLCEKMMPQPPPPPPPPAKFHRLRIKGEFLYVIPTPALVCWESGI